MKNYQFIYLLISPILFGVFLTVIIAKFITNDIMIVTCGYVLYSIIWGIINEKIIFKNKFK